MIDPRVRVIGAEAVERFFALKALQVDERTRAVVLMYTHMVRTRAQAHASGRPGPRIVTGDYRRSFTVEIGKDASGTWTGVAGTNRPQGRRLEYGFVGVDSLGRHYDQSPLPHWRLAMREVEDPFLRALRAVVA